MDCRSTSRAFFVLLLLPAVLGGCREEAPVGATAGTCNRLIALTPSLTETLFALGLGDRVVGVGDYTTWPPEAVAKPRLGGLFNPNLERVVSLRPDLAVLFPSERDLAAKIAPLGIDTLIVPHESLADVERSFGTIARRCGVPEAGERLAREWRQALAPNPLPGPPLKVMLSVGRQAGNLADLVVAGQGTFLAELLARLGGENAFADAPGLYPQIGVEEIVARAPDVILELRAEPLAPEAAAALKADWRELPRRQGRIEVIAGDYALTPGPRLPLLYREMRKALERSGGGS